MITTKEIRQKYPNPKSAPTSPGDYCVGGALCKFIGSYGNGAYNSSSFPHSFTLAKAIRLASSKNLTVNDSMFYARRIITFNTMSDFETAWKELDFALSKG